MPTPLILALALILAGYCLYYWPALTWTMISASRHKRMKHHLNWTAERRRGRETSGWRFW